jgi:hypothetical protein
MLIRLLDNTTSDRAREGDYAQLNRKLGLWHRAIRQASAMLAISFSFGVASPDIVIADTLAANSALPRSTLIFLIRGRDDLSELSFFPIELAIEASVSNDIVAISIFKRPNQHKLISPRFYFSYCRQRSEAM